MLTLVSSFNLFLEMSVLFLQKLYDPVFFHTSKIRKKNRATKLFIINLRYNTLFINHLVFLWLQPKSFPALG